jgi:RND family efflux transporter MFP subunit
VVAVAGGGYVAYDRVFASAEEPEEATLQTATVTRSDIVLSALGSGTLLPETDIDLVFSSGGLVMEVLVGVGDAVQAGDVLARLDTADLERAVTQAEISLRQAEINLEDALEPPSESDIQAAQDAVDQAGASLRLEQLSHESTMEGTLVTESLPDAQENYEARLDDYNYWLEKYNDGDAAYWYVDQAEQALEDAEDALASTELQVEQAVQSANNSLAQAIDQYNQAQANLESLLADPDEGTIESLEMNVQLAEMNLDEAREALEEAVLVAPFDGVVTAVNVRVGETASSGSAAITLADMDPPVVQFWVEEADMTTAQAGNPVSIVFEALPDLTFSGEITRVEPTLVTVDGTTAVQLWASVDTSAYVMTLFAGMNAEVEIVAGEALNALVVPVQALRELGPDQHAVFVVNAAGELEMRPVTVGLQDYVNAEILSGLEQGEIVSTGEAQSATSVEIPNAEMPGGDGMGIFGGGMP